MSLKASYRIFAPIYDAVIARATREVRRRSLARLAAEPQRILISGAGTGLDFPHLLPQHRYTALDFSPAMQRRASARAVDLQLEWVLGDSMRLPFADASYDTVVLHLILAVVPEPARCLAEAARVLRPGGRILVFDKFLRPGQKAPLRRLLSPVSMHLATRLDVVLEEVLESVPQLQRISDEPALAGGWFRLIELAKAAEP